MDMRLLEKPAKNLTDAEAFEVLMYLYDTAEIKLPGGVKRDPKDPDKILSPKPGQQLKVGTVLGDVTFRQASDELRKGNAGAEGGVAIADFTPTPAFAVVLYRLGVFLHDKWKVKTIICGGVGSGGGRSEVDCHTQGHCVDFYGVVRAGGGTIDVHRDWFNRPVYTHYLVNGKQQKLVPRNDDRWGGDNDTYFRLAASLEPQDATPRQFFSDVWAFVQKECTTSAGDVSAAQFRVGSLLGKGTIFHPDFPYWGSYTPGDAGRYAHHDHMHFQLGNAY